MNQIFQRRTFLKTAAAASFYSFFLPQLSALRLNKNYEMKTLRGNIGIFKERGGTIGYYASPKGSIVIDTQFPEQATNFVNEWKNMGNESLNALINTHHHGDHTSGNPVIGKLTETIISHENSKKNQKASAESKGNLESQLLPNKTFDIEHQLKVDTENVKLMYFGRAHTSGDAIVHFEETNVAHIGDLIFNRRFPYIDKAYGASIENWITVLDKVLYTFDDDTIFIWGHAGENYPVTGGKEPIRAFQNYLESLLKFGKENFEKGVTEEQLLASTKIIPGAEEWQGSGIERSIKAVYTELMEGDK